MPRYAVQPQWRSRRAAISKKGEMDFALLMESELDVTTSKGKDPVPDSPVSITVIDFLSVPEMKPLPGAWVTVGKGGRPVRESLMYDEPAPKKAAPKKKKRTRARKALLSAHEAEVESLVAFEEAPSSSKCLGALDRSATQREKAMLRGKEVKYWKGYQQAKMVKSLARDTLIAALANGGMLCESEAEMEAVCEPEPLKRRHDKGSSRGAKLRRKARFAAGAMRCYAIDADEETAMEAMVLPAEPSNRSEAKKVARDHWVRVKLGMAAAEAEVEVAASEVEPPSAKLPSSPNGKPKAKAKRDSKQCIVS